MKTEKIQLTSSMGHYAVYLKNGTFNDNDSPYDHKEHGAFFRSYDSKEEAEVVVKRKNKKDFEHEEGEQEGREKDRMKWHAQPFNSIKNQTQ